jgi:hypothetical protein
MKIKPISKLTFRDSIAAAYQAWGARRNEKFMKCAGIQPLVASEDQPHVPISSAKESERGEPSD